jgi:predicted ATPase
LEIDLFQILSSLQLTGYLKDLKIYFHKRDVQTAIEFDDLSEGEKQRLAVRGLMEIFRGEETLYLLDEPDTFAHPRWQWDFIPDIEEAIGDNTSSQTIFVTHSPLVLSTAKANAFWMEAGTISALNETFGQDANMSLVKMHAQGESEEVKKDFELYFDLIEHGEGESDRAIFERRKLANKYGPNHPEISRADAWIAFYK